VSKRDKLIQKIIDGNSDITPEEAIKILKMLGFWATPTSGSHLTFRKPNRPSVTVVLTQDPLKPYMLEKLHEVLKIERYIK
jgi:predicted RNA binding protein YcfA (HicA-like mRNA interferase family)